MSPHRERIGKNFSRQKKISIIQETICLFIMVFGSFSYYVIARLSLNGSFVVLRSGVMARFGIPWRYGYPGGSFTLSYVTTQVNLNATGSTILLDNHG